MKPIRRQVREIVGLLVIPLALSTTTSCGGDDPEPKPPSAQPDPLSEWAFHVFVGEPGSWTRVDLAPVPEVSFPSSLLSVLESVGDGSVPGSPLGLLSTPPPSSSGALLGATPSGSSTTKPQAVIEAPDGGAVFEQNLATKTGWALVYGAAAECGFRHPGAIGGQFHPFAGAKPVIPPWDFQEFASWSIFPREGPIPSPPNSCDRELAWSEILLCVANELANVADAVAPVTWNGVKEIDTLPGFPPGPWTLPTQRNADRFIARDLAIYMLATLAMNDAWAIQHPDNTAGSCADVYAEAAANPSWGVQNALWIFEPDPGGFAKYFPPLDQSKREITAANVPALAEARLEIQTQVLRTASRLLNDLIDKSVEADLAGAAMRRAKATDTLRGSEIAWGIRNDQNGKYNTLAHALRVVAGRWELSFADQSNLLPFFTVDPECGGHPMVDILDKAYGPDFNARVRDEKIRTGGQKLANEVVQGAGIIVPPTVLATQGIGPVKSAIKKQLVETAAIANGFSATDPQFAGAASVGYVMSDIKDADLTFALNKSFQQYQLLAAKDESVASVTNPGAGLSPAAHVTADLTSLGAVAVADGTPRQDATTDVMSRVAGIQAFSQCNEFGGAFGQVFAGFQARSSFQDSFLLGQSLQRRLVVLREAVRAADTTLGSSLLDDVLKQSEGASAEVRAWTGPGRIAATSFPESTDPSLVGEIWLFTLGFDPADFAVDGTGQAALDAMAQQIVLVQGPPWVADCAARLRTSCPANFETQYMAAPTSAQVITMNPTQRHDTGYDGTYGAFVFGGRGAPLFNPAYIGSNSLPDPDKNVYVVLRHDPKSPAAKGRVLGALTFRHPFVVGNAFIGGTGAAVSDRQVEHFRAIFGIGKKYERFAPGFPDLSEGEGSCIDGVPKDLFVPLENELTSDSGSGSTEDYESSWRHYLGLAKLAAQRADELGQQLIDLGLQQDFRREAANEELAEICGDFGAVDKLETVNGEVKLKEPADDEALKSCLGEDKYDLVFLTNDPTPLQGDAAAQLAFVKEKLDCIGNPTNPACSKTTVNDPDSDEDIETAGLGLATFEEEAPIEPAAKCNGVRAAFESLPASFATQAIRTEASAPWLQPNALKLLAARLRIKVEHDAASGKDEWTLFLSGQPLMHSESGELWPGCRRSGAPACAEAEVAKLYDTLFRRVDFTGSPVILGASQDLDAADFESYRILWRVQGALWMIGALSGTIPGGMFEVVVPAADFNGSWTGPKLAPLLTVYGTSKFTSGNLEVANNANSSLDAQALGPATQMGLFYRWPPNEAPTWLTDIYGSGNQGSYLHVAGVNPEIAGFGTGDVGGWIDQQAQRFSGMKCGANGVIQMAGDPAGGPTPTELDGVTAVGSMRQGKSWGDLCKNKRNTPIVRAQLKNGNISTIFNDVLLLRDADSIFYELLQQTIPPAFPLEEPLDADLKNLGLIPLGFPAQLVDTKQWAVLPPCDHPVAYGGMHMIAEECASDAFTVAEGPREAAQYTRRMLLPRSCKAGDRVQAFVNSYPPAGACNAAVQFAQAVALACNYSVGGLPGVTDTRPELKRIEELDGFVLWIDGLSIRARRQVSQLYLEGLPKRVVNDFSQLTVGGGSNKGQHGIQLLELRKSLETLASGWNRVSGDLQQLRDAVDGARLQIQYAEIQNDTAVAQLALQRLQIHAGMVQAAAGVLDAFSAKNVGGGIAAGLINAGTQMAFGEAMLDKTEELEQLAKDTQGNQVAQALSQLELVSGPLYTDLQNALGDIRSSAATVLQITEQIRFGEQKAKYEAAKASGADYVLDENGQPIKFPVNTVQRRLYDITRLRYERALKEAKYLGYVARLAVEQRIGARLATIQTEVGPLEKPATWHDDICSVTGIDYKALRSFDVPDGGTPTEVEQAETDIIAEFADQYVLDWVNKLESFVEYYNIEYPSHEGDDTTVLSLRDDLLGPSSGCVFEAPNLLFYSGDLTGFDFLTVGGQDVLRGWELNTCAHWDEACLRVEPQGTVKNPPPLPELTPTGGFSWLHDTPAPAAGDAGIGDAGVPDASPADAGFPVSSTESRTVSQSVELVAGSTYILSWWDQAREPTEGDAATQDSPAYRVSITDPSGQQLASFVQVPHRPLTPQDPIWSDRRSIEVKATQSGAYRVVFAASANPAELGSVLISNVQLEQGPPGSPPSAYANTTSSRLVVSSMCTGLTPEDVQKAFTYSCDKNKQCFYELVSPLVIDTTALASGNSRLNGKLAAGNFNFRHITVAVNLVGTGVYDCGQNPSQSCFANAYVEYSVDHDAFQTKVTPWDGIAQTFNFGSAPINHGKGLAAERYITLPISSADQALLAQPGITKPEYRGRPLDGSYRFRIWDSPYLVWNRLEDVQFVLRYRYWSKIQPQSAGD